MTTPPPITPPAGGPPPPPPSRKGDPLPTIDTAGMISMAKRNPDPAYCWLFVGVEGWGKTSLAAYIPDIVMVQVGEETGYRTLLDAGRVPAVPMAQVSTWPEALALANHLADAPDVKCHAWDVAGALERLCHDYVCERNFKGDLQKFHDFAKGPNKVAIPEWRKLLSAFERSKANGKTVILLSHAAIKSHKDPSLPESYDRYVAALASGTWDVTKQVFDEIIFCTFLADVKKDESNQKGTGVGGRLRVMHTERCDAYDAKDRLGLPPFMTAPEHPSQVWPMLMNSLPKGNA